MFVVVDVPWRFAVACFLIAAALSARPSEAVSAGPVEVTARGVDFRSHDETTGALTVRLLAEAATMRPGDSGAGGAATSDMEASLWGALLTRYDASGRVVLEVLSGRGSYSVGQGARLHGGVEIEWRLDPTKDDSEATKTKGSERKGRGGATARFRCSDISWDEASDSFTTDSTVRGRVFRRGRGGLSVVRLEGRGFAFVTAESRGEIVRDAVVTMDAPSRPDRPDRPKELEGGGSGAAAAFRATADGGLVFEGVRESTRESAGKGEGAGGLVIRMRGPVATVSRGSSARADELELRFAPAKDGDLELESGVLKGTVRALVEEGGAGGAGGVGGVGGVLLPGSICPRVPGDRKATSEGEKNEGGGRTELRAAVIQVLRASRRAVRTSSGPDQPGRVVLYGALTDPARVIFDGGELRGTRVEFTEGALTTDGGAPSEFVWGGCR